MATAIKYFDTAKVGYARLTAANAATDGSGTLVAVTWMNSAPTTDWFVTNIQLAATSATGVGDLADCLVHVFVSDGTNVRLLTTLDAGNPAAGTTALPGFLGNISLGPGFVLPSTVSLQFGLSVAPTAGNLDVVVFAQAA